MTKISLTTASTARLGGGAGAVIGHPSIPRFGVLLAQQLQLHY